MEGNIFQSFACKNWSSLGESNSIIPVSWYVLAYLDGDVRSILMAVMLSSQATPLNLDVPRMGTINPQGAFKLSINLWLA